MTRALFYLLFFAFVANPLGHIVGAIASHQAVAASPSNPSVSTLRASILIAGESK